MPSLPPNVNVSTHPSIQAKLSQLRSQSTTARDVKTLIHEITLLLSSESLARALSPTQGPKDKTPLGFEYTTTTVSPGTISIVPILRSGLAMVEGVQTILPSPVPVHHLGMYRETTTLQPVEYYNNLPQHAVTSRSGSADGDDAQGPSALAIIVDPIIATGNTCAAAVATLREWGAERIVVLSVLGAHEGIIRVAEEWSDGTEIWVAGVDGEITPEGMLKPGLGDVGDRLFLTLGK
ncbi:uracil phosphoribosyltransferase [Geosmithia morbida]|uniref:uracil phosphoribosyltransferase n=1 Tax=Geosmithia morbida TaxID=1094350 RepID=A0A9P4YRJ2_9HYPO|nr:uracil phosphoribosyltransferase [Geosmithia morbida]KAF4119714.1 uracil phosphoribosyltransferase [Geosmithia morbida]